MPAQTIGGFYIAEYEFTRSWGIEPGSASGKGVVSPGGSVSISVGDYVVYSFLGISFYGIISSLVAGLSRENGREWSFQLVDNRIRLKWGIVFGQWNMEEPGQTRGSGFSRGRKFSHILPEHWKIQRKTLTSSPKSAADILDEVVAGAIGGYSFGLNTHTLQTKPVMQIDANSGSSLAALISQIVDAQGLQVTIDGQATLRFGRRGEGSLFIPSDAHVPNDGNALSAEATRVVVVGGRTLVQVNEVPLEPDWKSGWEKFISEPAWLDEVKRVAGPFPDTAAGYAELAARAREITLREYIQLATPAAEDQQDLLEIPGYVDMAPHEGVCRLHLPVWTYLNNIVFRSYRIPASASLFGIPMRELEIHDQLLCGMEIKEISGAQRAVYRDDPVEYYPKSATYVIAKGQPLDLIGAQEAKALVAGRTRDLRERWSEISEVIVDASNHSIHFATPVFRDGDPAHDETILLYPHRGQGDYDDLSATLDENSDYLSLVVPNPKYKITPAPVKASFVFRFGFFNKTYGTGSRWTVQQASACAWHLLYGANGFDDSRVENFSGDLETPTAPSAVMKEILYDDGTTAMEQSDLQVEGIIARSGVERSGEFVRVGAAGTSLTGMIDRVTIRVTRDGGITETVEFAKPRASRGFVSSRQIADRVRTEELFTGQQDLARDVRELRTIAQLTRSTAKHGKSRSPSHTSVPDVLRKPFGTLDASARCIADPNSQYPVRDGVTGWKAGDIVWLDDKSLPSRTGSVFGGVVVMDTPTTTGGPGGTPLKYVSIVSEGMVPMSVAPGVGPGASIGAEPGDWYGTASGAYPIGMLAHHTAVPGTGTATLAMVRLGAGGGGAAKIPPLTVVSSRPSYVPEPEAELADGKQRFYVTLGMANGTLPDNWDNCVDLPVTAEANFYISLKAVMNPAKEGIIVTRCEWVTYTQAQKDAGTFDTPDYGADGARPAHLFYLLGSVMVNDTGVATIVNNGGGSIQIREYLANIAFAETGVKYKKALDVQRISY